MSFLYNKGMLKNIIFDIGNVLCTFDPDHFLQEMMEDEKVIFDLKEFYFKDIWKEYDRGYWSVEDMVQMGVKEYPEYELFIRKMMEHWKEYVLPIPSSMKLIDSLKEKGYDLYILSNIPQDSYEYLSTHYTFMSKMKGGIYSYQEKVIKPEEEIYLRLIEKYKIQPKESVFIDDRMENVEAAQKFGIYGIHCLDAGQIESKIYEIEKK